MIPPIPKSNFFEKIPEDDLDEQATSFRQLQDGFNAEMKVFRSFEDLKSDEIIVIHQLEYTNEQYSSFLPEHKFDKKSKSNKHGETDFVVIGINFVAVFEVKGLNVLKISSRDDLEACCSKLTSMCCVRRQQREISKREENNLKLKGCCEDAVRQRTRMVNLVKNINSSVDVYQFTIFPNISKDDVDKRYLTDKTLVFSEQLNDFTSFFNENIPQDPFLCRDMRLIKRSLLGLWCINQDNKWDVTSCSLLECILNVDEELKRALVTRQSVDEFKRATSSKKGKKKQKKYPRNDDIVPAPDLFRHYLNINCLSKSQMDVFNCNEELVWIDGPAGSGKTISMLGKIIQLALNATSSQDTYIKKRILLIMVGFEDSPAVRRNHEILSNIDDSIVCEIILNENTLSETEDLLEPQPSKPYVDQFSSSSSTIIILVVQPDTGIFIREEMLSQFKHIFFDDFQFIADRIIYMNSDSRITFTFFFICAWKKFGACLWFLCDDGQSPRNVFEPLDKTKSNRDPSLTGHLREIPPSDMHYPPMSYKRIGRMNFAIPETHGKLQQFDRYEGLSYFSRSHNMFTTFSFSVNLRNTFEISTVLSIIRKHYEDISTDLKGLKYDGEIEVTGEAESSIYYHLIPQTGGHFLRGTRPIIYLIQGANFKDILELEVKRLKGPKSCLRNKDVTVVSDGHVDSLKHLRIGWDLKEDHIDMYDLDSCMSAEWPALVSVQRHDPISCRESYCCSFFPNLYIALSRARVYGSILLYNYDPDSCSYTEDLLSELRQRSDVCKVVDIC